MHLRKLPSCTVLAVLAAAALAPSASAAPHLRGVISTMPTQLAGAARTGTAPAGQPMTVGVLLAHPDPSGEDRLLKALQDPKDPEYHHFLTPAQYRDRFGVPSTQLEATTTWLRSAGLRVEEVSGARDHVLATGTAQQVAALTQVRMASFAHGAQRFVGNLDAPTVPAGLPILSLTGLNTYQRYHTMSGPQANPDVGNRTAEELWSIYEQPSSQTGKGVPVAILGAGATDKVIADLHQFDTENKFPQLPVDVVHTPAGGDYKDESGNVEWNIDMQAIHGMAPDIDREVLYFSPTLADSQLTASLATWVNDPQGPPIMNASLGECEALPIVNPILNNAGARSRSTGTTAGHSRSRRRSRRRASPRPRCSSSRRSWRAGTSSPPAATTAPPARSSTPARTASRTTWCRSRATRRRFRSRTRSAGRSSTPTAPTPRRTAPLENAWDYSGGNAEPVHRRRPTTRTGVPNLNRHVRCRTQDRPARRTPASSAAACPTWPRSRAT